MTVTGTEAAGVGAAVGKGAAPARERPNPTFTATMKMLRRFIGIFSRDWEKKVTTATFAGLLLRSAAKRPNNVRLHRIKRLNHCQAKTFFPNACYRPPRRELPPLP